MQVATVIRRYGQYVNHVEGGNKPMLENWLRSNVAPFCKRDELRIIVEDEYGAKSYKDRYESHTTVDESGRHHYELAYTWDKNFTDEEFWQTVADRGYTWAEEVIE